MRIQKHQGPFLLPLPDLVYLIQVHILVPSVRFARNVIGVLHFLLDFLFEFLLTQLLLGLIMLPYLGNGSQQ